jgi:glucokinase
VTILRICIARLLIHCRSERREGSLPLRRYFAAANGESARRVIDRALEYLSASIVSLLHIFDPEVLIVGGNIVTAGDQLLTPLRTAAAQYSRRMLSRDVPIVVQSAVGYGGVLGAAGLIFLDQKLLRV